MPYSTYNNNIDILIFKLSKARGGGSARAEGETGSLSFFIYINLFA